MASRPNRGLAKNAAHALGMARSTLYKRLNSNPELFGSLREIREEALDFAESKLFELIEEGQPAAIIFFLKCIGKSRGYVERTEQTGKDGKDLQIAIVAPPRATSMEEWLEQNRLEAAVVAAEIEKPMLNEGGESGRAQTSAACGRV